MLALTSTKLTLLVLAGVPVVVVPIILFGRRVRTLARASQDRVGDVGAYVDESLHEIRTVQAYGHEPVDRARFGERVEDAFATAIARTRQRALLIATVIVMVFGAIGVILWIGGHDVVAGRITPGALSAFVFYAVIVASAVGTLSAIVRRPAARGRRDRAAVRVARRRADDRGAAAPRGASAACARHGHARQRDVSLSVAPRRCGARRFFARRRGRREGGARRPIGRRQDDGVPAVAALLRSAIGRREDRRRRRARRGSRRGAQPHCARAAGARDLRGERAGQRPLRAARRDRRRCPRGLRRRLRERIHRAPARALRQLPRRARRAAFRWSAPAARDRARRAREPPDPAARRGHVARSTPRASAWCSRRSRG